jgi:sirohydrochlorin ferrochelatase
MPSAILLIAHGSRLPAANDDLRQLAVMLSRQHPEEIVECSYLELAEPTIPQGMQACVYRGAGRVRMLPFFLSAGSHVSRDLERYRQQFEKAYPQVEVRLCPPIGLHPLLLEILQDRLEEVDASARPKAR